ncbi:MAG: hypothetical protein ABFD08_08155 [Syntrophomonas sp.]
MQEALFTWGTLATIGGAALAVYLVVLFTERLVEGFWKWGTDLYGVCWAFIILVASYLATGTAAWNDWRLYALCFFNAFIVQLAAGKLRDKATTETQRRQGVLAVLKKQGNL